MRPPLPSSSTSWNNCKCNKHNSINHESAINIEGDTEPVLIRWTNLEDFVSRLVDDRDNGQTRFRDQPQALAHLGSTTKDDDQNSFQS